MSQQKLDFAIHNETSLTIMEKMDEFFKLYDELKGLQVKACKEQGDMDKELSNVYHMIEAVETKHITQSHKIFLHLKNVLNRRRMSKVPAHIMQSFVNHLDPVMGKLKKSNQSSLAKHKSILKELDDVKDVKKVYKKLKIKW